ncbi:peptide MFS transporter [Ferruginibacter sp.]|nr:peptide MFS transporter [Ferruginibacter sp.]
MSNSPKHPKALPFLFFSEMWERFGYYLMIGIFFLYLTNVEHGFSMTNKDAADLYGTFIALVFLTPFIGGLLADRYFGYRKSIIAGGLMMGGGYCLMAVHSLPMLYLSMALVIFGNGFFKPNISTLLGNLYSTPQFEKRKDEGYNIFYMGINVGAFICNFFSAAIISIWGWKYAFVAAGIGMFLGVIIFMVGTKHYISGDIRKPMNKEDMPFSKIVLTIFVPTIIVGILGWIIRGNIFGSDSTDAFIFGCIPVIYFYSSLYFKAEASEKRPIAALLAIFAAVILFWAVFKQNGTALTIWADNYTSREVSGTTGNVFRSLRQADDMVYKKDSVNLYDHLFRLQKKDGEVLKEYNYPTYFKNVVPQNLPADGGKATLWATPISQSINPGWVILLTPLVVAFFAFLRGKKKEPSTATKIAFGLFISALSVLVMVAAVHVSGNGAEKASVWWLIGTYGVITVGELLLSPMGLSLVSKLSPVRLTSLMMGGWFLSTSIGNKLSGILATMWDGYENKASFFWVNFVLLLIATFIIFAMLKWLNRIMKEKGVS